MRRVTIAAGVVMAMVLTVVGCGDARQNASGVPTPPQRVRQFLGEQAVAVLSDAQKVEVYRVSDQRPTDGNPAPATAPQVAGYTITSTGRVQDAAFGGKLRDIFFSPDAYRFDATKGCIFQPDTVLRVHGRDGSRADFVLCFTCEEFAVTAYDPAGNRAPGGGTEDFDGVTEQLKEVVQPAFQGS